MRDILDRLKHSPLSEIFRLVRMPVIAVFVYFFYQHLMTFDDFDGWVTALKFDMFKATFSVVIFYLADRCLAHGTRAHDLTDMELQIRNATRVLGAAIVIGLSLSGG